VYVVTSLDNALVRFDRDPSTGALTPQGCIEDNDAGPDACAEDADGLESANAVTVSPDGGSVYVVGMADDALVRFGRDPSTGALTPQGCIGDNDSGTEPCAQTADALNGAISVAVSPDGGSVYTSSFIDNAVARFDRAPDGALTPLGCVEDNDAGPDDCLQTADGLEATQGVTVSPDGLGVFVVSQGDHDLAWFDRDPTTGALTSRGCIGDNDSGDDACSQSTDGLFVVVSVTVSADGRSVYTAGLGDDAVALFDRDLSTGALTPRGCVDDNDSGLDDCAQTADGLDTVNAVAVSPDGQSVYAAAAGDDDVARFAREPDVDPPETKIKGRKRTVKRRPKFRLLSDEPLSTFECKVDKKKWKDCGSPFRTKRLEPGRHRLKARATDTAGNTDPAPAKKRFRILER
jgi:6-phosphogluconolactonase (cycloisomerase 2 family)